MYRKIKTRDALILMNATTRFSMVVLLYKVLIPTRNTLSVHIYLSFKSIISNSISYNKIESKIKETIIPSYQLFITN